MRFMLRLFLSLRFLMLFGSLGAFVGGTLMFWLGAKKLLGALELVATADADAKAINVLVLGATDAFLFGVALFVIAYAIAFGFVVDGARELRAGLPHWMRTEDLGQLKRTLVEVVLVVLVVDFATDMTEQEARLEWDTLVLPIAILLIAAALRLTAPDHRVGD